MPVKVAGREVKVHLDTGAPFSVSLPTKYKDQLPLTAPAQQKGKARTHVGDFPIFQGTVDGEIEIGEFKLPSCEISFTDVVPHPGATPQGQLGYAALRDFVVTLDSANRRIQFARWRTGAEIKPAPTRADECSVWLELQQLHPRSNTCGRFFSENDASWSGLRCARWNDSLFAGINIARERRGNYWDFNA